MAHEMGVCKFSVSLENSSIILRKYYTGEKEKRKKNDQRDKGLTFVTEEDFERTHLLP